MRKRRKQKPNVYFFESAAASEPNLLMKRLKQSVIERKTRVGILAARRQVHRLKQHQSSLIGPSTYQADLHTFYSIDARSHHNVRNIFDLFHAITT